VRQLKAELSAEPKKTEETLRPERTPVRAERNHLVLLGLVLALGFFARTWEYGRLPPSLNPDEASNGVDAFSILRYGQDRNAVSYPVKFVSWGSGQDALYGYLLVPVIALWGLSPVVVRMPMLVFALATMPLTYLATRRIFGPGVALMAVFMLAISPWHVLLSRWALESNLLPFVFLAGFTCLLMVRQNGWWFLPACVLLALCLYAYGTAYVAIPAFLVGVVVLMRRHRTLRATQLWLGLAAFAALASPIGLLLTVNQLGLNSIRLGPFTVPRFPVAARWETTTLLGAADVKGALSTNMVATLRLLATESDAIPYNVLEPFGIFYRLGLALALAGFVLILAKRELHLESKLLLLWLAAGLCVGPLIAVNINRFNIIFIPLLILGARALHQVQRRHRALGIITVLYLLAAFLTFTLAYHGQEYRGVADFKFQNGVIPALLSARARAPDTICVTDKINMPYIYALLTEPISPSAFQSSVKYVDSTEPLRRVASFGKYVFGTSHCLELEDTTYVLTEQETPPRLGNRYAFEFFDNFVVYSPVR